MKNNICCIFNYAPHYREPIYQKMDKELKCHFYFGDTAFVDLKKLDYSKLKGFKGELKTLKIRSYKWQFGISKVFSKKYTSFIITGDPSYLSSWLLLLYCYIFNKKLFLWCHGLKNNSKNKGFQFKKIFYKNRIVELLLYGNYSRDLMINIGYNKNRLHVIYNSLDYDKQFKLRNSLAPSDIYEKYFQNKYPILLFIGRLENNKKLNLIIESQKRLSDLGIFVNTVFIGKGEMEQLLLKMVREYNLEDRVWFIGPCYEEEFNAIMIYNATLTVSPGNIGLTTIHSLVYGTPVITHSNFENQNPEFEAITPGKTGDFFKEDDVNDLVRRINNWLKHSQDNREEIRTLCYKIVDLYFNPNYQIKLLKKIIK